MILETPRFLEPSEPPMTTVDLAIVVYDVPEHKNPMEVANLAEDALLASDNVDAVTTRVTNHDISITATCDVYADGGRTTNDWDNAFAKKRIDLHNTLCAALSAFVVPDDVEVL